MPSAPVVAPVLGRVLTLARQATGQSQDAVGRALGTTQSTVSAWEAGKLRPSLEQLVGLCRVLGADRSAFWDAVEAELEGTLPEPLPSRVTSASPAS